ncbi:ribonuclease H-like domain-containing protein [Tanacetum coccineum]|uniref:Ribonuclease H-like domain-containing protein n=1 Tax=Tanacetum coccineum TaxID=301880 RepID=A0ABQ5DI61_9ASTR
MTHPHPKRSFVLQAVLTRLEKLSTAGVAVNTVRPVNTANTIAINTVRSVNTDVSKLIVNHPRTKTNAFKRGYSQSLRPFNRHFINKNSIINTNVNTARVKHTTARDRVVGNPQQKEYKKAVIDSGCSRHMAGNKCYLDEYEDYDGGFVSFGDGKGRISRNGKIKTGSLDFDDVYFCKKLKYNLFSVSQIYDKKNNVLFTDTECLVLSSDFKLLDESQVLLRVPRKDNIYSVDLKSVVPTGGLTCLIAKATIDESNTWPRRLRHINFKTMNKLVKGNLVKGLPSKIFENDHSCVALDFLGGLRGKFSVARTPQQHGVAERKNRTLIEGTKLIVLQETKDNIVAGQAQKEKEPEQEYILIPLCTTDPLISQGPKDYEGDAGMKLQILWINTVSTPVSTAGPSFDTTVPSTPVNTAGPSVSTAIELTASQHTFDVKFFFISKMHLPKQEGESGIVVKNKARLVAQGHTQKEGIDYDEVFYTSLKELKISLFLAFASFQGFVFYQMDVKKYLFYMEVTEMGVTTAGEGVTATKIDEITTTSAPTTTIDEITLAQTLIEIKAAKPKVVTTAATTTTTTRPKARGVVVQEPSEFRTTTSSPQASQPSKTKDKGKAIMIEPEVPLKKKDQVALDEEMARNLEAQLQAELIEEERLARKKEEEANIALIESWENTQAMMEADRLLAERLQTREQEELTDEEKAKLFMEFMEKRRKHFAALRAQEKRKRPPTKTQKRNQMSIYLKHMGGYKHNQLKGRSYDEIQKLFDKEMKRVNSFVAMNSEAQEISGKKDESSSKKAEIAQDSSTKRAGDKLESDKSKKQKTDENEEVEVDNEAELKMHMVIVKDDDIAIDAIPLATKPPMIGIDREDLQTLWKLVKTKHGDIRPEAEHERVLWGDLKVMFKPDIKSDV